MITNLTSTGRPSRRIVIVGGVAGGMSAAARARRLDEHAEIIVLEQGDYVSLANYGLPYHLSGEIDSREDLLLHTPATLARTLNLDVRIGHRVTAIDRAQPGGERAQRRFDGPGGVRRPHPRAGRRRRPPADRRPRPPRGPLPAHHPRPRHRPGRGCHAARAAGAGLRRPQAVVVGAGFIGLEAVEALAARGLRVHLVELADHVLPPLDAELAPLLADELTSHGVDLHLGVSAQAVTDTQDGTTVTLSDGTVVPTDLVIVGVRPAGTLAAEAGLELSERGAIRVDGDQRTSDPHIRAVGDAVEVRQAVTGTMGTVPLGPANRQGRRAANSICGHRTTPQQEVLGTAIVRVVGLTAAVTGANQATLRSAGIDHEVVHLHPGHHAGYFSEAEQVHLVASFVPDRRLLGAQAVGRAGVDKPGNGHLDGALTIPHTELRHRLDEVRAAAEGRPVAVHCASGVRSYLATRILRGEGIDARNLSGGWLTLLSVRPDVLSSPVTA